jgi:hypothetical protein
VGGVAAPLDGAGVGPPLPLLLAGAFPLQVGAGRQRLAGPVFQVGDDLVDFLRRLKGVAATGGRGEDSGVPGARRRAGVGDDAVGVQVALLQLQQAQRPGVAVALLFNT